MLVLVAHPRHLSNFQPLLSLRNTSYIHTHIHNIHARCTDPYTSFTHTRACLQMFITYMHTICAAMRMRTHRARILHTDILYKLVHMLHTHAYRRPAHTTALVAHMHTHGSHICIHTATQGACMCINPVTHAHLLHTRSFNMLVVLWLLHTRVKADTLSVTAALKQIT